VAVEYGFTGFEAGDTDFSGVAAVRGFVVGVTDLYPRTGQFMCAAVNGQATPNAPFVYHHKNTAIGNPVGAGNTVKALTRVFFRIVVAPSLNDTWFFSVGGLSYPGPVFGGSYGGVLLNTDRTFAAATWNTPTGGANSTTVLALTTWYRADLTWTLQQSGANTIGTATCSVYDEAGAFLETVTNTTTIALTAAMPPAICIANGGIQSSSYHIDYDDWWWGIADGADVAGLAFPTATRVTRVPVLAQGSVAQWTGDYRTQQSTPIMFTANEQNNAAAGQQTLFTKDTAATLGITGIEGAIVRARMRSNVSSGNESLLMGGVAYTIPVTTAYPTTLSQTGVNYAAIADATFDGWEFGARNDRGTDLRLTGCYIDVLHAGSSIPAPYTDVTEPFRLNIITYVGNGTYKTVTGMGFGAQTLWVKPNNASITTGGYKIARAGGTICYGPGASGSFTNAVLALTDDGFLLGPSSTMNQNGTTYVAIGIRDGGAGGGFYHSTRTRCGNGLDNQDVPFREPFSPDFAFNCGSGQANMIRTSAMVGDLSLAWSGGVVLTDQIQAMIATGFQVGTATFVNGINNALPSTILRIGAALGLILHVGTITPSGATATITGIPFTPVFVSAQKTVNGGFPGYWRCSLVHAGLTSVQWSSASTVTTGITSITADGFTIGSSLATNGVPVHWFAFAPGALSAGGCIVSLPTGADSGGGAGCAVSL
jgi:hypothetical protein